MPIVTTRCVVLQVHRYSDTSKILRLMTLDHGPRSAMARGALRPRSKLSGLLEPFAEGIATVYLKANRDLHTLSDFELLRERQSLGSDLRRYAGASVLCELVLRLAPEHRDEQLYRTLTDGLNALVGAEGPDVLSVALGRIWALVSSLGFAPILDVCVTCGRELGAEAAAFDHRAGGLACDRCSPVERLLPPPELLRLRRLASGQAVARAGTGRQTAFLTDFIRHHAAEGYRIRSLDFLSGAQAL